MSGFFSFSVSSKIKMATGEEERLVMLPNWISSYKPNKYGGTSNLI